MMKLATIEGGIDGRITLVAEAEHHPDHGTRYRITALLPGGEQEDTEVSGLWGGGLASAQEAIGLAWGASPCWDLRWL